MRNALHCNLKALFVLEKFTCLFLRFCYAEKWLDKKAEVKPKIHDVTDWTTNNYNTHIVQYLRK